MKEYETIERKAGGRLGAAPCSATPLETTIPCHCGSSNARWYGDRYGLRQYMCDACYLVVVKDRIVAHVERQPDCGDMELRDLLKELRDLSPNDKLTYPANEK